MKKEKENCEHDWVYENRLLLSDPPQRNKVCRKCGMIGRDTIGEMQTDEYSEIMKKPKK